MKTTTITPKMMTWLRMTDYGSEFLYAKAFTLVSDENDEITSLHMITSSNSKIEIKFMDGTGPVYAIVNVSFMIDDEMHTTICKYDVQGYTIQNNFNEPLETK